MDPAPPDSKRQRIGSWAPSPTTHGLPALPHPHTPTTSTQLPPPQPQPHPLPPPPPGHPHHLPPPNSYPAYPARSADSAPTTPAPIPGPGPAPHHPDTDRRHHEPEPYAPMQDHYRQHQPPPQHPSARPSYPYPQHPPPLDTAVKREPLEDHRRPSATGHGPESLPPTPHPISTSHPPPPPPAYPESQPRHMSYDNGHPMPPTPGGYRAPSYPPSTPISHQPPYEQHASYQQAPEPFYSVYPSSISSKKKNTRASQACDQCRQLKAKCDETKPCKTCRDKGSECRYRDPVPKASDKTQADILDGITAIQQSIEGLAAVQAAMQQATQTNVVAINDFRDRFDRMDQRLIKVEGRPGLIQTRQDHMTDAEFRDPSSAQFQGSAASGDQFYPNDGPHVTGSEQMAMRMMAEDEIEAEPGPPVPPGEPAIPINHTTLNGLLLEWPSIRELTKHHVEREGLRYISEFPISQEQNRGLLSVFGRGEDSNHARAARELADHGTLDIPDDSSDLASSPSPAADWGQLGGLSPPDQVDYRGGVLGSDGNPDFTEARVWSYVESFKENILNMHPIIQPKALDFWVRHFLDKLPTTHPRSLKPQASKPAFAVGANNQPPNETTGAKRKRSPGPDGSDGPATPGPSRIGRPDRSIHSALVLTVLALGKICLHRDNIPDVVHTTERPAPHGSPMARNGVLASPSQGSPPSYSVHSHSSGLPSPKEQPGLQSRRSSIHGPGAFRSGYSLKKNYEVIPGLEYFAYATDILGNHTGAYNNMKNVYANIFAGLYQGQLARPMESFAFIHKASHVLQVIMRPSLDKLRRIKLSNDFPQDPKYNQLALTFWTCLQLEIDLIAELQLPPSGLLSYEEDMPHPNMSMLEGFNQRILDSYPGQLYLRTHLNSIHRMFYAPDDPNKPGPDKFKNVDLVADAVSGMNWVAHSFAFSESDPPADDILAARLRAKYWGAQGITYRPFIRQILQFNHSQGHPSSPNPPSMSEFRKDIIAPTIDPNTRSAHDIPDSVVELAKKGIKALVESTRAFHGLGDKRPIITNVFGTAHAQWGNLLILSAAFRDPVLHRFVDEELLRTLFHRTIHFLRQSATATSSLRIDMHILEGLQRDLFHTPDPRTNSSFSSNTSTQAPKPVMAATPIPAHLQMGPPHGQ